MDDRNRRPSNKIALAAMGIWFAAIVAILVVAYFLPSL